MTAEVVILNRNGVGIAVDSIATLPSPDSSKNIKTYHTQNKLFSLSSGEAVAVMFYGSCYFGPYPWETVIKEYRRDHNSSTSIATFEEYGSALVSFLQRIANTMPSHRGSYTAQSVTTYELRTLRRRFIEARKDADGPLFPDYVDHTIVERLLRRRLDELHNMVSISVSEDEAEKQFGGSLLATNMWQELLNQELHDVPLSDKSESQLLDVVKLSLRKATDIGTHSGLLLAGFGEEDMLPAVLHYWIDGIDSRRQLRYARIFFSQVDDNDDVFILPFAQTEVIDTYLRGIHPHLENYITRFLKHYLHSQLEEQLPSWLEDIAIDDTTFLEMDRALYDVVDYAANKITEEFSVKLDSFVRSSYVDPIRSIVRYLPKDGLGEMAEALVGLTSLTRRITPGDETVGGEIDVAVITKGDGLIWINRKHYFRPELNPRYFQRVRHV